MYEYFICTSYDQIWQFWIEKLLCLGIHKPKTESFLAEKDSNQSNEITVNDKIIKNKLGLLNLAQELGNVSKACQMMGFSRDTFYRYKSAVEEGGVENLLDQSRRKPNLKNRIDPILEKRIVKMAVDNGFVA